MNERLEAKHTVTISEYLAHLSQLSSTNQIVEMFDSVPLQEVRKTCLERLPINSSLTVDLLIKRVRAFLAINDYPTVLMLLHELAKSDVDGKNILRWITMVAEFFLERYPCYIDYLKETLVILCGKINHHPELYDNQVRAVLKKILEKYDRKEKYGSYERESRILSRVFLTTACAGDKNFLPLLQRNIPDKKNLAHLIKYTSVCRDKIEAEAIRILVIRYLENL